MKQKTMSTTKSFISGQDDYLAISLQPQNNNTDNNNNNNNNNSIKKTYTVDEAITAIGIGTFQYKILIVTGLLWAADAVEIMRLTFLMPVLADEWNLNDGIDATIGAVVFFGMLIGNILWANFSDKYGRRWAVIGSNFGQLIFGMSSAACNDIYSMIVLRFLTGFCLGGSSCAFTLYAEYAPKNQRGKLLVLQQSFWAVGCTINALIAWIVLELLDWRWYIIISNIPMCVILLFAYNMPESVRYLVQIDKINEAQNILNTASKQNNGTNEPIENNEIILTQSMKNDSKNRGNICDIFGIQYFNTTIVLFNIMFVVTFGYYGISFLSENFFADLTTNSSDDDKYWQILVTTSSEIPGIFIAMLTLDRYGRKNTLIGNFMIFTICMFALMYDEIQNNTAISVTLVFFTRMCASIEFLAIYIYFTEYYPTQIRNTSLGLAAAVGRTAGMITTYISQLDNITYSFYLYGMSGAVGIICCFMLKGDTAGKDLTQISSDKNAIKSKLLSENNSNNNTNKQIENENENGLRKHSMH